MTEQTEAELDEQHLPFQIFEFFSKGGTLGSARSFDAAHYEALYALGHNLYSASRYEDALQVFAFLSRHNHLEPRYLNAYAGSLQMVKSYAEAITFYSLASLMDIDNPLPTYHTAECMLALGWVTEAQQALDFVLSQSDASEYAELHSMAQAMKARLN